MELDVYQRSYIAWTVICALFGYVCLDIEHVMSSNVYDMGQISMEWLYFIFIAWVVGISMIWMANVLKRT